MFSLKKKTTLPKKLLYLSKNYLDGIENLGDLPRLVSIDKKCGNLKVFVDAGDVTRNINQRKSDVLGEIVSSVSMRIFGNQVSIIS